MAGFMGTERNGGVASLRGLEINDAERLAHLANYKELAHNIAPVGSFPYPYTVEHAIGLIEYTIAAATSGTAFHFGVQNEKGDLIGVVAITKIDQNNNSCEIGYWLGKDYHGKGYGRYAVSLIVSFAFKELKVHKVSAISFKDNKPSIRILEKIGFKREGVLRESAKSADGKYSDEVIMSMLEKDFERSKYSRMDLNSNLRLDRR